MRRDIKYRPKVYVYVDGFNLYYNALKGTKYKWLDLNKLVKQFYPNFNILKIKYFTARVSARMNNPQQPMRQQIYIRALETLPNFERILGKYQSKIKFMPLVDKIKSKNNFSIKRTFIKVEVEGKIMKLPVMEYKNDEVQFIPVYKNEEKGSDVNLAVHLVNDAHKNKFDRAIVISNDGDLREAIKIVNLELKKKVYIISPDKKVNHVFTKVSYRIRTIISIPNALADSQFPNFIKSNIRKPDRWY